MHGRGNHLRNTSCGNSSSELKESSKSVTERDTAWNFTGEESCEALFLADNCSLGHPGKRVEPVTVVLIFTHGIKGVSESFVGVSKSMAVSERDVRNLASRRVGSISR